MDIKMTQILEEAGIHTEEAIRRFSGNETLYLKFLVKFLQDPSFPQIKASLEKNDLEAAFVAAHTLKGVAGNLGLQELFHTDSVLVEDLRLKRLDRLPELFQDVECQYQRVCAAISSIS